MDLQHNNTMTTAPDRFEKMTDKEYREYSANYLEDGGWKRETAGEDWERGLDAFVRCGRTSKPRRRGILVTGTFGCGKTAFVKACVHKASFPCWMLRLANRDDLDRIDREAEAFNRDKYDNLFNDNIFLDDLGAECLTNDYGVKRDLVGDFITEYHYCGKRRLYITTNLTAEEIANRYGGRVADRLKELCVPLAFKGASKRRWA